MFSAIWRLPGSGRVILASILGRAPTSIFDVALILFVTGRSNLALAGLAAGLSNGLGALCAPALGRLLDRYGRVVLLASTLVHALLVTTLLLAQAPILLVLFSALSGIARPPLSSVIRAGWSRLAAPQDISLEANRFETLTSQVVTVIGPAVCAAALALGSPSLALAIAALGITISGLLLCSRPRLFNLGQQERIPSPLRPLWQLLLVTCLAGMATGAVQVALPARALEIHAEAWSALWYGAQAAGGALFTLCLSQRQFWRRSLPMLFVIYAAGLTLALLACDSEPWLFLASLFVAGMTASGLLVASYQTAQRLVETKQLTETFAAKGGSAYVGVGVGSAALGSLAALQASYALACAPVLLLLAGLLSWLFRLDWRDS